MESYGCRLGRAGLLTVLLAAAVMSAAGCDKGGDGEGTGTGAGAGGGGGTTTPPVRMGGESFSLAAGFTPLALAGRSGGSTDASTRGPDCVGNIGASADHTMTVTGSVAATLSVVAEADTTLVVLGPGGPYCNDDTNALNPAVTATFAAGTYEVFIGNYSSDEGPTAYTLAVTPPIPEGTGMQMPEMPEMPTMGTGPTGAPTMPPTTPPTSVPTGGP